MWRKHLGIANSTGRSGRIHTAELQTVFTKGDPDKVGSSGEEGDASNQNEKGGIVLYIGGQQLQLVLSEELDLVI